MEALLEKRKAINNGETPVKSTTTTKSDNLNKVIDTLNYYSFGYVGTIVAIIYNSILKHGIIGSIYQIIKSAFFFVDKTQYYPNIVLNNIFGFVSKPLERLTKNTSKPHQSK